MGINAAEVPNSIQNALSVLKGVDFALLGYLPMSEDSRTGLFVELGHTNTPFGIKYYGLADRDNGHINQRFFTISPYLLMSGFTIGLDFGFALKLRESDLNNVTANLIPMKSDINVNLRIGGMVPLLTSDLGTLNFIVNGTYSFTGLSYCGTAYTYRPSTLSMGLNYLFNLEGF
jgi:hypothetical protein